MKLDRLFAMINRIEIFQDTGYYSGNPTHGFTPDHQYFTIDLKNIDDKQAYIMNNIKIALFVNYRKSRVEAKVGKPDYILFTDNRLGELLEQEEKVMGSYLKYDVEKREEPYFTNTVLVVPVLPDKPEVEIPNVLEFGIK
ncbi:hypothetical protein PHABIO_192 [Pseudomonas phage Phabio]|uniref:Uncharacterized protein n=1 Tax=Pseudomonas phage Phabio TaxID=2006668 RepID=A0A1Y0SYJ5_9CAUD|nr:hypothetical protein MZD05_gp192 [Pseudomonas phage Phabio]ARV76823.1 hypothetical protein PHABIO_192 [Pseudomonas phage Phabio]